MRKRIEYSYYDDKLWRNENKNILDEMLNVLVNEIEYEDTEVPDEFVIVKYTRWESPCGGIAAVAAIDYDVRREKEAEPIRTMLEQKISEETLTGLNPLRLLCSMKEKFKVPKYKLEAVYDYADLVMWVCL